MRHTESQPMLGPKNIFVADFSFNRHPHLSSVHSGVQVRAKQYEFGRLSPRDLSSCSNANWWVPGVEVAPRIGRNEITDGPGIQELVGVIKGRTCGSIKNLDLRYSLKMLSWSFAVIRQTDVSEKWFVEQGLATKPLRDNPSALVHSHRRELVIQNNKLVDRNKSEHASEQRYSSISYTTRVPHNEESFSEAHRWLLFVFSCGLGIFGIFCLLVASYQPPFWRFAMICLSVFAFLFIYAIANAGFK
jgi:hypothetical protein